MPRDWSTGELVIASYMNTEIRDIARLSLSYLATTAGDTLYATAANATARLGIGASGTILGSSGTAPQWVASSTITTVGTLTSLTVSGAATVSGGLSTTGITLTAASGIIIGGATDLRLNNAANNGSNLIMTDAGAATFRGTVSGVTTLTATTLAGTLSTAAQPNITSMLTLTLGSNAATDALQLILNGTSGTNRSFSMRSAGTEIANFAAAADGNTYIDYQGQIIFRSISSSPAYTTRLTLNSAGGLGIVAVNASGDVTCARLDLSSSGGTIFGGSVSTTIRNSADSADNVVFADAGNVTFRSGSVLSGITTVTATSIAGTLTTAAQPNITSLGTLTTSLSIGTNPATTGAVRLANNTAIYWRNGANTSDSAFIKLNTFDYLVLSAGYADVIAMNFNGNNRHLFGDAYFSPGFDNQNSLGLVANRWTVVYAVNGTIQTSHSSAKNFEQEVTPAGALDVARQTARGSGFHRFTYKGDPADTAVREYRHIGIKAESTHAWLSPDGQTVNPQTTATVALAAVAGEADAREADIARLTAELAELRKLVTNRRN